MSVCSRSAVYIQNIKKRYTQGSRFNKINNFYYFPGGADGKESACNVEDLGLTPGLGRSPGEGKGYPLQYSDLEKSMDCIVHGVAKSRT